MSEDGAVNPAKITDQIGVALGTGDEAIVGNEQIVGTVTATGTVVKGPGPEWTEPRPEPEPQDEEQVPGARKGPDPAQWG